MTSPAPEDHASSGPTRRSPPPRLTMEEAALTVVRALQEAGHIAYFAGGCVRDMVMGQTPTDYDVATSAQPDQVSAILRRTRKVGAKFGVVLARISGHDIEIATFRRDLDYQDGRRPSAVEFTDAREDAIRRDFTINGMFYDPIRRELVDFVGGRADIEARIIRAIGDPHRRFAEDHLRLLRAIRFAARFDYRIDPDTWSAMQRHAPQLVKISPERIREELDMMLSHRGRARAFRDLRDSGVLRYLWPTAERLLPRADEILALLSALPEDTGLELCLAIMLLDYHDADVGEVCDALRCSNDTRREITWLIQHAPALDDPDRLTLADLKLLMADRAFDRLVTLLAARLTATGQPMTAHQVLTARIRAIDPAEVSPPPLLSGRDLSELGVPPGPLYKKVLDRVYYAQLNRDVADRESALRMARELIASAI